MPLVLFGIVFIWTPPHFWSLALWAQRRLPARRRADAAGGGRARRETRRQIMLYTLVLVPLIAGALLRSGFSGLPYGVAATVLGAGVSAARLSGAARSAGHDGRQPDRDAPAKAAFKYSILYLFALFGALALDRLIG